MFFLRINLWLFKKEKRKFKKRSFIKLTTLIFSSQSKLEDRLLIKCIILLLNFLTSLRSLKTKDSTLMSSNTEASKLNMSSREQFLIKITCLSQRKKNLIVLNHTNLTPQLPTITLASWGKSLPENKQYSWLEMDLSTLMEMEISQWQVKEVRKSSCNLLC